MIPQRQRRRWRSGAFSARAEIRAREIDGLIELPRPLKPGDRVRIERVPLAGLAGLYAGQEPAERVLVLLTLRGRSRCLRLTSWPCKNSGCVADAGGLKLGSRSRPVPDNRIAGFRRSSNWSDKKFQSVI